ncbi:MAG TPA: hypothetical protein VMB03_31430 [Bryobacteraceae bacterium]|nr:hypothetical protein [Bryobacteraceae bacterium]
MDPNRKIEKELRFLKAWVLISTLLLGTLLLVAAGGRKGKFDEIDTERINILGSDGKLRLTLSNNEKSPGPVIGGHVMTSRNGKRGAGLIFFNDNGDECGGMTWQGQKKEGMVEANGGLMFDQYDSDQTVGIQYSQHGDSRSSGLHVWERSLTPMAEFAQEINTIELMKDGPEKSAALQKVREKAKVQGLAGIQRVFVGRTPQNDAVVLLMDTKGNPRIKMQVDGANSASLEFLDENGKTIYSLPERAPAK